MNQYTKDNQIDSEAALAGELVLASSSPRRRQLLEEAGYRFGVIEPLFPEPDEGFERLLPSQQAEALAYFKARAVLDHASESQIVLGADTIVALGGERLGKPADEAHARRMLAALSGTRHVVITGVALLQTDGGRLIGSEITYVTMRTISPAELDAYIASGEWIGKAGAYAIQETADRFVTRIDGSFSNIVGLPMERLARMLRELRQNPAAHRTA